MDRSTRKAVRIFGSLAAVAVFAVSISAQITITIPKIPKIRKPQPTATPQPAPEPETTAPDTSSTSEADTPSEASAPLSRACSDPVVQVHLEDLGKTRAEAAEFRAGMRDYYVSTLSDRKNVYLEAALSSYQRKQWLDNFRASPEMMQCLPPALDELAEVARKTLPAYKGPAGYALGTPAEKKALLGAINDLDKAKVLKVGIKQANWMIDKNSYGLPTARYKHGVIWAKYSNTDDGFCRIFWVNLVQDYAGGGTYGASYGNFISRAIAGCPAEK